MTLEVKNEVNYSAFVVAVEKIIPLDKCDNVVGVPVGGYVAIVGKDTQVGDVLVVFPAESQLSDDFVRSQNLYRDPLLNADPAQKGYIEKNRRVKAMKFRGHRSDALAMPASTFDHPLVPGDVFDTIDGVEVCRKYVLPVNENTSKAKTAQEKAWKRVDDKFLPEHVDTEHYGRNSFKIDPDEHVIITQKLHGTSCRIGHTIVKRQLTWIERLAKRLGVNVAETEFDHVFGSRKVIKDPNNPNQDHYYKKDVWTEEGMKYAALIPENVVLYGELVGWIGNEPIQKGYTYNVPGPGPVPNALCARTMVESCTCQNSKISPGARSTLNDAPTLADFAAPVTNATYETVTPSTQKSGERSDEPHTTDAEPQGTDLRVPTTSSLPTNVERGLSPNTGSPEKTTTDSPKSALSAGPSLKSSASITTTGRAKSEVFSATSATGGSDFSETMRSVYETHSSTCRVRQDFSWTKEGLHRKSGEADLYVYRVAVVSNDGHLYDLSWNGVKEFCAERGLNHVPELANGLHRDFAENADIWLDRAYHPNFDQAVPLAKESPCDEGVCIRVDGVLPFILKHKSPEFLRHESATLDAEVIDIETVESRDV